MYFDQTQALLEKLVGFPTVSTDSNLAMIEYLANRLQDVGAKVDVMSDHSGTKANLFATIGPEVSGGILLSGHCDVVPVTDQAWSSDPFKLLERDGNFYGRGTCDMKGFIAASIALAPMFATKVKDRPLHFAFTYDEETGCIGAGHLAENLRARGLVPAVAIVGEPTEMRIIEGHKGCYEYTTHFHGLEGHGSSPERGVNAVEYAVRYVNYLLQVKENLRNMSPADSRFDPPWSTVNVGAFNGGVAHNVIASKARVDWEMRPVQKTDADYVKASLLGYCENDLLPAMRAIFPDARIETQTIGEVEGLIPSDVNEARRIVTELTGRQDADVVPFGTEAGIFQAMGMDVVLCGPGSIAQAHKADEFVAIDQIKKCLTMLERLGDKMSA
ncbi:MAG: acetylornithine deacetylase [Rhodobacter sp. BACL10 MAG-120910-bin24]|jgi:acetylornithine deacetylase|nr:MAG: acetylornithine deacetylase [Rhodobacter sp. BACL10 MAG-120910-bin24]MDO7654394.1 acetylornithine deacetylase [Paracoccaceae bacterium]|tara:strand:+ start:1400 stop:2557 length:1158 start_codon:yes stop_codon:yes gene_type:complete